jgi:peptidoglycan/xylan/chitin deacetylase (PgdA/CDA1 family)
VLLAVSYHYVSAEPAEDPRAIFPVTVDELAAQVALLGDTFEFVSRDELLAAVAGDGLLPGRACMITFDDGLRCQIELALPVLERLGAPAVFFVPGKPLAEGRALPVHKLQAIRERMDDARLLELLERDGLSASQFPAEAVAHYRYDTPEAARVKYLFNVALPPAERELVVDRLFSEVVADEADFVDELYASREQVRELERSHGVGAHSYGHEPPALMPAAALERDLERVRSVLIEVTGSPPRAFSYPYGSAAAVDPTVARRVEAAGFEVGFTMERALNLTLAEPLLLARLDANDVPGGKRPLLELGGSEPAVLEGATASRERYFDEWALVA